MTTQPEALRLADECDDGMVDFAEAATELRRLHTENETLRTQHLEAHKCTSAIFGALTQISILTDLGGEVAEYEDVFQAVRHLNEVNQELLEALQMVITVVDESEAGIRGEDNYTYTFKTWTRAARAAIAKATGETK